MQLKLTWRVLGQDEDLNVLVSDEQKLFETMQVLVSKKIISQEKLDSTKYVKALRTNTQVNLFLTYKEGKIYSGDILQI